MEPCRPHARVRDASLTRSGRRPRPGEVLGFKIGDSVGEMAARKRARNRHRIVAGRFSEFPISVHRVLTTKKVDTDRSGYVARKSLI